MGRGGVGSTIPVLTGAVDLAMETINAHTMPVYVNLKLAPKRYALWICKSMNAAGNSGQHEHRNFSF